MWVSVFKLLHAGGDEGKIRTPSRVVGGLGHIVGVIGKRYFRDLVVDLSSPCWEGNVKCEN